MILYILFYINKIKIITISIYMFYKTFFLKIDLSIKHQQIYWIQV